MNLENEYEEYTCKILLVGDQGVGKTSFFNRCSTQDFETDSSKGSSICFRTHEVKVHDKILKLQIWDDKENRDMDVTKDVFYSGAQGVLFMYDITNRESFSSLDFWLDLAEKQVDGAFKKLIIGNKTDLEHERQVSFEEAKAYAEKQNLQVIEISVKDLVSMDYIFSIMTTQIFEEGEQEIRRKKSEQKDEKIEPIPL